MLLVSELPTQIENAALPDLPFQTHLGAVWHGPNRVIVSNNTCKWVTSLLACSGVLFCIRQSWNDSCSTNDATHTNFYQLIPKIIIDTNFVKCEKHYRLMLANLIELGFSTSLYPLETEWQRMLSFSPTLQKTNQLFQRYCILEHKPLV